LSKLFIGVTLKKRNEPLRVGCGVGRSLLCRSFEIEFCEFESKLNERTCGVPANLGIVGPEQLPQDEERFTLSLSYHSPFGDLECDEPLRGVLPWPAPNGFGGAIEFGANGFPGTPHRTEFRDAGKRSLRRRFVD
jgi:hypothetical protein